MLPRGPEAADGGLKQHLVPAKQVLHLRKGGGVRIGKRLGQGLFARDQRAKRIQPARPDQRHFLPADLFQLGNGAMHRWPFAGH